MLDDFRSPRRALRCGGVRADAIIDQHCGL
jgi:hypothetical protein